MFLVAFDVELPLSLEGVHILLSGSIDLRIGPNS